MNNTNQKTLKNTLSKTPFKNFAKGIIVILLFLIGHQLFAQVGVGNTNPQAQLDISASDTNAPTNLDGILIPRVTNLPANISMTANQDGMLVFYDNTGEDGKGFYYWDETANDWIKISVGGKNTLDEAYDQGGAGTGKNIFADNGAVRINGTDGFLITGTFNAGANIESEITGSGVRMFFNPRTASFRTGRASNTSWDSVNLGLFSFSAGDNTNASGYGSASFGLTNSASGDYSFVSGVVNSALGESSAAFGRETRAIGDRSFSVGFNNDANAGTSTAFGISNNANGSVSFVTGVRNNAESWGESVFGLFSRGYTPAGPSSFDPSDRIFTIGNGTAATSRSNALTIYKSGLMNINDEYNMPLTDGSLNQVMATDGSGNVNFVDATSLVTDEIDWYEANTTTKPNNINDDIYTQGNVAIGKNTADYPLEIENTSNTMLRGLFVNKSDTYNNTTNDGTSAIFANKIGNGDGRSHGFFSNVEGTGTGQKYGIFNRITSSANGNQYGTRNYLNGGTSSFQFGTFNNIDNSATGNQYGVYNGMRGASANNLYGVYNEFERAYTSPNYIVGVRNRFTNGTPGTNGMNGVYTDFTTSANGTYYGVRTEFTSTATGTGDKYGSYNFINNSAGGIHYGVYSEATRSTGYAGYFLGRFSVGTSDTNTKLEVDASGNTIAGGDLIWRDGNTSGTILAQMLDDTDDARFILREDGNINVDLHTNTGYTFNQQGLDRDFRIESDNNVNMFRVDAGTNRIGIGLGNPSSITEIFGNSNGTVAHLELTESAANDGGRIKFTNSIETNDYWTLYGRADNTIADARFNLFHSTTGNVMIATGNGDVGIGTTPAFRFDTRDNVAAGYVSNISNNNGGLDADGLRVRLGRANPTTNNVYIGFVNASGAFRGRITGNVAGTGTVYNTASDRRLKTNIVKVENALELIYKIQPRLYEYKENLGTKEYGFIAQELQSVYPQAVSGSPDSDVMEDPMMVDYGRLTPILTAGIKELKQEVETLKEENLILKAKLEKMSQLEARLLAIEKQMNDANNYVISNSADE